MKLRCSLLIPFLCGPLVLSAGAAVITVTTTNNVSPATGQVSLLQALTTVQAGDEIRFNIPGTGPHYIPTPPGGYPFITNDNVTINGYSQPTSLPNTNSILAANNAKIQIVLDSRDGGHRLMTFPLTAPNDDRGYLASEAAVLGVVDAKGFRAQGLSFLGVPQVGTDSGTLLYFISFARGASGHIDGCWLGVDPDGKTVAGGMYGITAFRYRGRDGALNTTNTVLVNHLIVGVEAKATNPVQQFNVMAGTPGSPIIVEGDNTRIAGNFLTVLPDGLHDFDVALDAGLKGQFQGTIQIGRGGNSTLIGTDGDGVNDANERNVFGGMLSQQLGGFPHLIHFYSPNPGTNVVVAGNYFGIGVDGKTKFTNGVAILNGAGDQAQYRIGSNLDGVSDSLEGNLVANNYPSEVFPASVFFETSESLGFLSLVTSGASVSLRGNSLINNFPFPASPLRDGGTFLSEYYAKALLDPSQPTPVLNTNSTRLELRGTLPVPDPSVYGRTVVDVYIADPIGMTNGMAAQIPELPQGFVQGLTYLGSFTNTATTGEFQFDIRPFNVPAGTPVTITANYVAVASASGGEAGQFALPTFGPGGVTLSWDTGLLQSSSTVDGPWTDEDVTGTTVTVAPVGAMRFFRLKAGGGVVSEGTAPPLTSPFSNAVTVR